MQKPENFFESKIKISRKSTLILMLVSSGIWASLMLISMAFVVYDTPLSMDDEHFLLAVMLRYYPAIMLLGFIATIRLDDKRGILSSSFFFIPTIVLVALIYNQFRVSIIDGDNFETKSHKEAIYQSAFGNPSSLEPHINELNSVDFSGDKGLTLLLAAYKGRNDKTFDYLLKLGADVNLMPNGKLGYNVANYIIGDFNHDSSSQQYFEKLVTYGLDFTIGTELSNLLQTASTSSNKWYLEFLLSNGVDANRKGSVSLVPIAYGTLHKKWENVLVLLPYSDIDSLTQAAGVFHEYRSRYINSDKNREEFEQELLKRGIDFDAALNLRINERARRLKAVRTI